MDGLVYSPPGVVQVGVEEERGRGEIKKDSRRLSPLDGNTIDFGSGYWARAT